MTGFRGLLALALFAVLAGCDDSNTVAKAAGHELTVEDGVALLGGQSQLPNEREVAEALANIWVDFILVASLAAEDSTLASVDYTPLTRQEIEQELVYRLRQQVIEVDSIIEEDELRSLYEERSPGAEVRARHILLNFPDDATESQRDSVTALAGDLRARAVGGEPFEALAEQYSADPGSAREGGDLGFFERDQMVEPFADAAFSLQPGEVSEPVESMFGLHVIRVEERRVPDFEEVREGFLAQLRGERVNEAEMAYLEGLEGPANIELQDDAVTVVRELARSMDSALSNRAGRQELVTYEGGAYTAAQFSEFLRDRGPQFAAQIEEAADEDLTEMLRSLTRGELLVAEARNLGLDLSDEEKSVYSEQARSGLSAAAREAGFHEITVEDGETRQAAIGRVVLEKLEALVQGQGNAIPLGPLSASLRMEYDAEVNPRGVDALVERIAEVRGPDEELPEFLRTPPSEP